MLHFTFKQTKSFEPNNHTTKGPKLLLSKSCTLSLSLSGLKIHKTQFSLVFPCWQILPYKTQRFVLVVYKKKKSPFSQHQTTFSSEK